jgi:hypothetical protein
LVVEDHRQEDSKMRNRKEAGCESLR